MHESAVDVSNVPSFSSSTVLGAFPKTEKGTKALLYPRRISLDPEPSMAAVWHGTSC